MPIIAVNLSASVFEDIKARVEKGRYASPEQFMEIAAFNQLALERGLKPDDLTTSSKKATEVKAGESKPGVSEKSGDYKTAESRRPAPIRNRKASDKAVSESEINEILNRLSIGTNRKALPPISNAEVRPASEHLWGQVNRLFPLKFACRWLYAENSGKQGWEQYDVISDRLANDAATIGSLLEKHDMTTGRKRDELLATGLPRRGNLPSRDRFLSQFVARTTRASEIYPGAICQYALADFNGDHLELTQKGLELAKLENPVIDGDASKAKETVSEKERKFFRTQIVEFVPGELQDFVSVLNAVMNGQHTPETLLASVRSSLPPDWSDVMVRTHVSGVVARLSEVNLLHRKWEGRNVKYEADEEATEFAAKAR